MRAGNDAERSDEELRRMTTVVRPELVSLVPADRDRVLQLVAAKGGHCESCGGTDFEVGHALYLGYLFLDEDDDAYMVALTCRNPECGQPHTAIRLRENDFLSGDGTAARAATWLASAPSR
jgi:hypothetical protein